MFSKSGQLLVSSDEEKKTEIMQADFFPEIIQDQPRIAQDYYYSQKWKRSVFFILMPVLDCSGKWKGALAATIGFDSVFPSPNNASGPQDDTHPDTEIMVTDRNGILLFSSHRQSLMIGSY